MVSYLTYERYISIHALREEGDIVENPNGAALNKFLSTPSVRRATVLAPGSAVAVQNFYPRPP